MPQDSFNPTNDADVQIVEEVRNEPASPVETATDMMSVGNNFGQHASLDHINQPSTSSNRTRRRLLHFSVHYNDRIIQVEIPDTGTVGGL